MGKFEAFIGPSSPSRSSNVNLERTINLYLEAGNEGGAVPKARNVLYGTPGLSLFQTLPTTPVRGLWSNATRLFAVGGSKLYECFRAAAGTCNATSLSKNITWVSGNKFDALPNGTVLVLNGVAKVIDFVTDSTHLTLTTTAGAAAGAGASFTIAAQSSLRGDVGNDGLPVTIVANGQQLLIVSAGIAYCDNGAGPVQPSFGSRSGTVQCSSVGTQNRVIWVSGDKFDASMVGQSITINAVVYTVSAYVSPTQLLTSVASGTGGTDAYSATIPVTALIGAFLDTYFIVTPPGSRQVNISAPNDGSTWSSLDFGVKEGYPDNIVGLLADHEELWVFGTDTIEVWQDTGAASFPLARIPGAFIHHGLAATWSPSRLASGVAWLSTDPQRGGAIAYLAQGFQPQRISTHAVETTWDGYSTISDAVSFTYTENGHEFWVITFPTANATWVFDATSGTWTQRAWWNGASNDRQRQMFHASFLGLHMVGDWANGNIYQQSTAFLDDNGTSIHWDRTAPHISQDQTLAFYSRFQLDCEVGQSLVAPSISLSWSDDGGHTFNTPRAAVPATATYDGRLIWRRMGRSRDRVFRATGVSGATRVALMQAFVDVEQGAA